jgi:glycosyltransferase involved in cell wall biosynthesis
MRIALANHTPVVGSGSGTYTAMVAEELARRGHQVCVITPLAKRFPVNSGVLMYPFPWRHIPFPSFTGHPLSRLQYSELDKEDLIRLVNSWRDTFRSLQRNWKPSIVHVQHIWVTAKGAVAAGFRPIVTCHGSELDFADQHEDVAQYLRPEANEIAATICVSRHVSMKRQASFPASPIDVVIANPYNDRVFRFSERERGYASFPHLGFVGRLVRYKNCAQFIECIAHVRLSYPQVTGTIIGDGPERIGLETLAERLGIANSICFTGLLPQESLAEYYSSCDVLVVPSDGEPFGLVVLESLACGTPVVVTQSGGLAELVSSPFVLGCKPKDLEDLVGVVLKVLGEPHDRLFRSAASDYVRTRYSLLSYVDRLESLYCDVLSSTDASTFAF